jgi:hypothetical protein
LLILLTAASRQLVIAVLLMVLILWLIFRQIRFSSANRKYRCKISGGRPGSLSIELEGGLVRAETDVGLGVDMIIFQSSLSWEDGRALNAAEVEEFFQRLNLWSASSGMTFELANDT